MSGRIIFMTEEESMTQALRNLLPRFFPDSREFEHWLIISHRGKTDLESSYPRKMQEWQEPGSHFIILRDNGGADCRILKGNLISKIPQNTQEYLVRIVCQELESWFLGDLAAVAAAFPDAARNRHFRALSKKDPDQLTNAADLIKQLTGTGSKIARAAAIARNMQATSNRSYSFQIFLTGLSRFLSP